MNKGKPALPVKAPGVAPSIFAADFFCLEEVLSAYEAAGADMVHYDVMDNHFVPNISFGPKIIEDIISRTNLPADVHLMIDLDKTDKLKPFLELPAGHITLHLEAMNGRVPDYIEAVKKSGKTAGLSIKPGTPVKAVFEYLDGVDLILLMSVEPGYSGQKFIPASLERLRDLKGQIGGRSIAVQIDGGINKDNYRDVFRNGAGILVIGSAFFEGGKTAGWIRDIKKSSF